MWGGWAFTKRESSAFSLSKACGSRNPSRSLLPADVRRPFPSPSLPRRHLGAAGTPPTVAKGGQACHAQQAGGWLRHGCHHAEAGVVVGGADRGGDVETAAAAIVEIPGAAENSGVGLPRPRVIPLACVAPLVERAVVARASRERRDVRQVVLIGGEGCPRHRITAADDVIGLIGRAADGVAGGRVALSWECVVAASPAVERRRVICCFVPLIERGQGEQRRRRLCVSLQYGRIARCHADAVALSRRRDHRGGRCE